jgi:hypothetical protein
MIVKRYSEDGRIHRRKVVLRMNEEANREKVIDHSVDDSAIAGDLEANSYKDKYKDERKKNVMLRKKLISCKLNLKVEIRENKRRASRNQDLERALEEQIRLTRELERLFIDKVAELAVLKGRDDAFLKD